MSDSSSSPATDLDTALTPAAMAQLNPEAVAQLAARLEADSYGSPFGSLQDWRLLRAIAFQRPELAEPYLYLLDLEDYDES
jgi:hypothetical protein